MDTYHNFPIDLWDFKSRFIIENLPCADFQMLTTHMSEKVYQKGEAIFREGTFPCGVFHIINGKVKKYKTDKEGREIIIYIANSGELIGYHAILAEDRFPDSAAALEESLVAFIPKNDFIECFGRSEMLKRLLIKTLSHEFAVLINSLAVFSQKSVRQRLALQLAVLREKDRINCEKGVTTEIKISRDDLAHLVGTARETVIRLLTEFKHEGVIETKGTRIIVHDVNRLIEIGNVN